jgi:hypothetical protein
MLENEHARFQKEARTMDKQRRPTIESKYFKRFA